MTVHTKLASECAGLPTKVPLNSKGKQDPKKEKCTCKEGLVPAPRSGLSRSALSCFSLMSLILTSLPLYPELTQGEIWMRGPCHGSHSWKSQRAEMPSTKQSHMLLGLGMDSTGTEYQVQDKSFFHAPQSNVEQSHVPVRLFFPVPQKKVKRKTCDGTPQPQQFSYQPTSFQDQIDLNIHASDISESLKTCTISHSLWALATFISTFRTDYFVFSFGYEYDSCISV